MTAQQILKADLLDLLFENRNKEYGAYVLRRDYPSHLKKAMGIMLLLILALFLYAFTRPSKPVIREVIFQFKEDHTLEKVNDKPKDKKPEQRTVKAQSPTKPDYVPKIVDNPDPAKQVPDRTDTAIYNPGSQTTPGTGGDNNYVAGTVDPKQNITPVVESTPPVEPEILDDAEIDPEFPGGKDAWMNFLQRMLRVPDDMEEGERKTVQVKFVVNADGEVTDAVIIQSAGNTFDREVLRVINRMPKWKPGKQRGRPVAVYFTQPVTFTAQSE